MLGSGDSFDLQNITTRKSMIYVYYSILFLNTISFIFSDVHELKIKYKHIQLGLLATGIIQLSLSFLIFILEKKHRMEYD